MDADKRTLLATGVAEWASALEHLGALHEMGLRDAVGHPELEAEFKQLLAQWRKTMAFEPRHTDEDLVFAARAYLRHLH